MHATTPRSPQRFAALVAAFALLSILQASMYGQEAPKSDGTAAASDQKAVMAKPDENAGVKEEQAVLLSPFEVSTTSNQGYVATSSLAGTRLNTELKDVASAIQIFTPKFLEDTGATNVNQLLLYATNAEVSGPAGNYFGAHAGDTSIINRLLVNPSSGTRIRGLDEADQTRDYFPTDIPLDSYNIDQVDIQRGPNSILYGLGSPAGIINYSLKVPNMQKNSYSTDLRVGQYNEQRESVDLDQTILPGVLGVRVDLLNQSKNYEQAFKYERTHRGSVTARWSPKLADSVYTAFTLKYEDGKIDSDHPREAPPVDMLTPWFNPAELNKYVNTNVLNNGAPGALGNYVTGGPGNNWWDSLGLIYGNPSSDTVGVPGVADAIRQRGGNPWSGWISPANPNWNIYGTHLYAQKSYFANNPTVTSIINNYEQTTGQAFNGFGGWPDQEILNPSIFNYRTQTVEGPNSTQFNKFNAINMNFVQTYLNGRTGVEVAYDHQEFNDGYDNIIGGQSFITIDINPWFRNGQPNPNLGRPYIVDSSDANIEQKVRESVRSTAFYKLDFKDALKTDNLLTQFLGSHVFTLLASSQKDQDFSREFALYRWNDTYTANDNDDRVFGVHYLGPSLLNSTIAGGLNIQGLQTIQTPPTGTVNAMVQGKGSLPDWSILPVGVLGQAQGLDNLYTGASAWKDQTTTKSFIWQSKFFDGNVVGLFGWRDDNYYKLAKPQNVPTNADGKAMPYDPSWSWDAGIAQGDEVSVDSQKTTWGLMVHTPEFIKKHLPYGTDISLGYNQASNFQPSQVSTNVYGMQNPAPAGKSREYNILISTLNDKVSLRITKYKTTAANSIFNGTAPNGYDLAGVLARTMDGMMTETYLDGNTFDSSGNITAVGRQNTTPEWIINQWMFGTSYDKTIADTPLPAGWTVQNHPELLTEPLRIRASAASTPEGSINPATGQAYTEPPITAAEANYRKAWFAAQPDSEWYRPFGEALFKGLGFTRDYNRKWGFWPDSSPGGLAQTADTVSKGTEYELNVNVKSNLRFIFDASKNEAVSSNIMPTLNTLFNDPSFQAFFKNGYSPTPAANYWQRNGYADIDFWGNNNNQTFSEFAGTTYVKYLTGIASNGRDVDELRKWHCNAIGTYDFVGDKLKGLSVGGAVRWQSEGVIGYYPEYLQYAGVWISDLTKPIHAKAETNCDLWVAYKRKIWRNINWKVQLNIRDLFQSKGLIPTAANPDGTIAQARIPATTSWELSNRFEF